MNAIIDNKLNHEAPGFIHHRIKLIFRNDLEEGFNGDINGNKHMLER